MISKRVAINDTGKSNFVRLAKYITNSQGKAARIESIKITNCKAAAGLSDPEQAVNIAVNEILFDQLRNKRAQSDRTYHLLISFRAGEHPSTETLNAIEASFCEALGYGDHQRISAVHNDTDNLHIHVAINKIHPERLTIHEPKNDYWTLNEQCIFLEKKYGLEADNHIQRKTLSESRAADMEAHTGEKTFLSWMRENLNDQLKDCTTWKQLFEALEKKDVLLRSRGAGLVFQTVDGMAVKASSVNRAFSKKSLEEKLGAFPGLPKNLAAKFLQGNQGYKRAPLETNAKLYAAYQKEKNDLAHAKKKATESIKREQEQRMARAQQRAKLKYSLLKPGKGRMAKKIAYAGIKQSLAAERKKIREDSEQKRLELKRPPRSWADWLRDRAQQGDNAALAALRGRASAKMKEQERERRAAGIKGVIGDSGSEVEGVTKNGTIIFKTKYGHVRDDGKQLLLPKRITKQALLFSLYEVTSKQGKKISLTGTKSFQERAARLAGQYRLDVVFTDQRLEQLKQEEVRRGKGRAETNGRDGEDVRSGGRNSKDNGIGEAAYDRERRTRAAAYTERAEFYSRVRRAADEINIDGLTEGGRPDTPPRGWDHLQHLSRLNVASNTDRDKMLVSPNALHDLDGSGTNNDQIVRWSRNHQGAGEVEIGLLIAQKYIQERADKRLAGYDVAPHRLYEDQQENYVTFKGVRTLEGQPLILFQAADNSDVLVKPINVEMRNRLRQINVGDQILIREDGQIITRPKSRSSRR